MTLAFVICLALQAGVVMLPAAASVFSVVVLNISQWGLVAALSLALLIAVEISKAVKS